MTRLPRTGAPARGELPRRLPSRLTREVLDGAVLTVGPPGAPALLLLHGTRRTRAMWRHQLDGLADAFRVIALDLPAHGVLADVPFRLPHASAIVAAVIEGLPAGRAVVVGQSLGGYVGMDLAARRPEVVAGLVLACASAEPRSILRRAPRTVGSYLAAATGERLRARRATAVAPAGERRAGPASIEPATGTTGPATFPPEPPATSGWLFKGAARALVSALQDSFLPRLAAYPGPTLIVNGVHDAPFRRGERAFLARAQDGRLQVVPGAGHLLVEEEPAAFNGLVRRFALEAFAGDWTPEVRRNRGAVGPAGTALAGASHEAHPGRPPRRGGRPGGGGPGSGGRANLGAPG